MNRNRKKFSIAIIVLAAALIGAAVTRVDLWVPGSLTDNSVPRKDGTSADGKLQSSGMVISDANVVSGVTIPATAATLTDAGGYFATDTAEAALQELGPLAGAAKPVTTGFLYVDTAGSDSTGTRNRLDKPFLTIAAALAAASAGDTISIGPGTFAGNLTVGTSRVTFQGAGSRQTIVQYSTTQVGFSLSTNVVDVTFADLEIDGQRSASVETSGYGNTEGCAILLNSGNHRTRVHRCYIKNPSGHGIFINNSGGDDVEVLNCRFESVATSSGLVAKDVRGAILNFTGARHLYAYNYFTGFGQTIGLWNGAKNCRVLYNELIDNWGKVGTGGTGARSACEDYANGVAAPGQGQNLWIGNVIDGTTNCGFEIAQGVVGTIVANNITANCLGGHISITSQSGSGSLTSDILISGNRCYGPGSGTAQKAIMTGDTTLSRVRIADNLIANFSNTGASGVIFIEGGGGFVLTGNQFVGCGGVICIRINNSGNGVVVADNRFVDSGKSDTGAIYSDSGSYHVFSRNTFNLGTTGYRAINLNSGAYHRVSDNTIKTDSGTAMSIAASDCIVSGNVVESGSASVSGSRNIIRGNTLPSLTISGTGAYNIAQDNRMTSSAVSITSTGVGNIGAPNHTSTTSVASATTQIIGFLRAIDLNSSVPTDTTIPLGSTRVRITGIIIDNASTSLGSTSAVATIRDASGGGGNQIVASAALTGLTATTKWAAQTLASYATTDVVTTGNLYFRLTTAHGSTATCDVYVMGEILK